MAQGFEGLMVLNQSVQQIMAQRFAAEQAEKERIAREALQAQADAAMMERQVANTQAQIDYWNMQNEYADTNRYQELAGAAGLYMPAIPEVQYTQEGYAYSDPSAYRSPAIGGATPSQQALIEAALASSDPDTLSGVLSTLEPQFTEQIQRQRDATIFSQIEPLLAPEFQGQGLDMETLLLLHSLGEPVTPDARLNAELDRRIRELSIQQGEQGLALGANQLRDYQPPTEWRYTTDVEGAPMWVNERTQEIKYTNPIPATPYTSSNSRVTETISNMQANGTLQLAEAAADKWGVPINYLLAVITQESGGNPRAIGDGGRSWGMGQLYDINHETYGVTDQEAFLNDPALQLDIAARMLKGGYERYGNWLDALHNYNGWGADASVYAQPVYDMAQGISVGQAPIANQFTPEGYLSLSQSRRASFAALVDELVGYGGVSESEARQLAWESVAGDVANQPPAVGQPGVYGTERINPETGVTEYIPPEPGGGGLTQPISLTERADLIETAIADILAHPENVSDWIVINSLGSVSPGIILTSLGLGQKEAEYIMAQVRSGLPPDWTFNEAAF